MAESKSDTLPEFDSVETLVEFFETHDMGAYWDQMPEAEFEIDIKQRTHLFAIDEDLAEQLSAIAKSRNIPTEKLINTWLREKLSDPTH